MAFQLPDISIVVKTKESGWEKMLERNLKDMKGLVWLRQQSFLSFTAESANVKTYFSNW